MKPLFVCLFVLLWTVQLFAQAPEKMSYQAVVRNTGNELIKNQKVRVQISILQGSANGSVVFFEQQTPTTNDNGLMSLVIGTGTVQSGSLSTIDWQNGPYFLKTEIDVSGGNNFTLSGVTQFLSVPFALYAQSSGRAEVAESVSTPEADPVFAASPAAGVSTNDITNWNSKLGAETDPLFKASPAGGVTDNDITNWNSKLGTETDPQFSSSPAATLTSEDITRWNNKLDEEADGDPTNEIQCLSVSLTGDTLYLSGCNYVIIPGISAANYIPNAVTIRSTPAGAAIYLNGANLNRTTPAVIENILPNTPNFVRVYLPGYNEYWETFEIPTGGHHFIDAVLTQPEYPIPQITINNPLNGTTFNDNVITLSGIIRLVDEFGNVTPFTGTSAILTLNGIDQQISVNNGNFSMEISILNGENRIQVRANSVNGDTGISDERIVYGDFTASPYEITLTWNTPTSDMDLHVWSPSGAHCYYGSMNKTFGSLDIDDIEGYGPETFTFVQNPEAGVYVVKINSYSLDRDSFSDCTVKITSSTGVVTSFGPHRFTTADRNGSIAAAWWDVLEINVINVGEPLSANNVRLKSVSSLPEWLQNKIQEDMKNLPPKAE